MKKPLLFLTALLATASPALATLSTNEPVTLAWDYPAAEVTPDLKFNLYHSDDPALPLQKWVLLTSVSGTNLTVTVRIEPGRHFFYLTAQNWWGESNPSNVASTPAPPRCGTLVIRRGL